MTQRELENIIERVMMENPSERELLRQYTQYIVLNYASLEEIYNRPQPEVKDRLRFQMRVPSAEERALMERIEEAKRKETFSERLLRLIKERNKTAPEVYRAAGVDYRHFSKINSNRDYKPSKETVCAFAIALNLSLKETEELLEKAGFALSPSNIFDVSIKFFIENNCYDRKKIDLLMESLGIPLMPQNY